MNVGVVIVCAGKGKRLGKKIDKALLKLRGKPLFYHTFKIFQTTEKIKQIVLVLRKNHFSLARKLVFAKNRTTLGGKDKRVTLVEGGPRRNDSVYNGLLALGKNIDYVLIHDGARPFVSRKIIRSILGELKNYPAVICGIKSKDTLKLVKRGFVKKTLDRESIFLVQTPQGFRKGLILRAYKEIKQKMIFDDAQLIELMGKKVKVVAGSISNIKITYPEDIILAKAITDNIKNKNAKIKFL